MALPPGRLEKIKENVFIDYANNEDAYKKSIQTLKEMEFKKIITVCGMGCQKKEARSRIGKTISELSDYLIITSDNSKDQDPKEIVEEIAKGIKKENYEINLDRREAIKKAIDLIKDREEVVPFIAINNPPFLTFLESAYTPFTSTLSLPQISTNSTSLTKSLSLIFSSLLHIF